MKKEAEGKKEFKLCSKCGRAKPLTDFHKDKLSKSWYGRICKDCEEKYASKEKGWYGENLRERYKRRKEKDLKYCREYRDNHKYEIKIQNRKYRQSPNGKIAAQRHNNCRRARKASAGGDGISTEQWLQIIKKQRSKCNVCGRRFTKIRVPSMDHIVPLSKGGTHDASSIQALCRSCNSRKSNKIQKGFIQSWARQDIPLTSI